MIDALQDRVPASPAGRLRAQARPGMVIAALAIFALAFQPVYGLAGPAVGVLILLPVIAAAWSFRPPVVVAVALVAGIIQPLEFLAVGNVNGADPRTAVFTTLAIAAVGWILSDSREARRSIARLIATDPATGLLNRASFAKALGTKLAASRASLDLVAIDIRQFREITETFGHEMGDELLRTIGQRLRANVEGDDRVARIGSGKFLMLLRAGATPLATAQAVLAVVTSPFKVAGTEVRLVARVAVARHPEHASTAAELINRLEVALDGAKTAGSSIAIATARSEQERLSRLETFAGLRAAIANGELRLHYQPIVELPSTALRSVEALVRWQHPERGLLAPGEFIPVAEQSGLIVPLTTWMLTEALRQSRAWSGEGRSIRIAVNIGAKSLAESVGLPALVAALLRDSEADPALLSLEVTESDVMEDAEQAIACLRELKALGVHLELDDFGTGYSSLAYLQKLPVDAVKIDRSFITPLFEDAGTTAIVRAAIELSHALGLETVAEGVEDEAVVQVLSAMGCDAAQGYVFARSMPADKLVVWIAARSRPASVPAVSIPVAPAPATGTGATVLVVDDEHPFRVSAHRILSAQGYTVLHAATASEALRLCAAQSREIDLVLTDLFLTDWQGHQLAAHLKTLYPRLRVMFMSGDPAGRQYAGSSPFLAKPFSRQQLVSTIADAIAS